MSWAELAETQHGARKAPEKEQPWPSGDAPKTEAPAAAAPPPPGESTPGPTPPAADPASTTPALSGQAAAELDSVAAGLNNRLEALAGELASRVGELESELESSIAVLFEQIGRIDDKLAAVENRFGEDLAALRAALDALASRPSVPEPAAGEPISLNSVRFDDLRALGLSVTQAARVIAYRDTHGGFSDFAEIEQIRGLSADDLRMLRLQTTL